SSASPQRPPSLHGALQARGGLGRMLDEVEHLQAVALAECQALGPVDDGARLRNDSTQDEARQIQALQRCRAGEQGLLLALDPQLDPVSFGWLAWHGPVLHTFFPTANAVRNEYVRQTAGCVK